MRLEIFLKLQLIVALSIKDSLVLTSDSTPMGQLLLFPAEQVHNIQNLSFENAVKSIPYKNFLFLVDLTYSQSFNHLINSISSYFEVAYLSLFHIDSKSKKRLEVHMSPDQEFELILSLISFLGLDSFTVLSSSDWNDSRLAEKFKSKKNVKIFYYSDKITETAAESLVLKILKTQGLKYVVLIDSSSSLNRIEKYMEMKRWDKPGVVLIRTSRCTSDSQIIGTLQISEEGTEGSKTLFEYHYKSILNSINRIDNQLSTTFKSKISQLNILETLQKLSPISVNLINFKPESKKIGTFNLSSSSLNINSDILYPGNTSSWTLNPKSTIVLSIANGTHDPYYSSTNTYAAYLMNGANYAVLRSNKQEEIPKFEIKLNPNDCGLFWYDARWYTSCFSPLVHDIGIGLITTMFSESLKGNIYSLRSLNKIVPHVSPLGASPETNNQTTFPELVKLEATPEIFSSSRIVSMMALGYRDIIVIATNESALVSRYELYKSIIEKNGMRIVNDENSRFLNWNYHRDNFSLYEDLFHRVRKTRCTLVLIMTYNHGMVLEALYDVGYRQGEILYLADTGTLNILNNIPEPFLSKRIEMVSGSLIFAYREFVGDYGMKIKEELLEMFQEVTFMCMTFDTFSVFKEAIIYLLNVGADFEDYEKLMKTIRMNRFTGCLGNVFFESNGNTRSSAQVLIQQIIYNSTDKTLRTIDIAYYNRFSSLLYDQFNEFEWPNGSMPPNYIPNPNCLAESKNEQESVEGKKILYLLSFGLFLTTALSGIFSYFRNRETFEVLEGKIIISFEDMIFYSFFFLEFLQVIAMGPDQDVYKVLTDNINLFLSFDLEQYFTFKFERFWFMFYAILTLCAFWIPCSVIKLTKVDEYVPEIIRDNFKLYLNLFLYLIGHLLFLPCTSMILNIYSCYRGTGDDIQESYLKQDCHKHCYKDHHKNFAIIAYVILSFFLSLAIIIRPKFQHIFLSHHIKIKPLFLIIETCLHVTLVILNKTLKEENQTTHGIVFCIIICLFLGFTFWYSPYNFKRPLVCHCGFIVASLWAIFTSTVFHGIDQVKIWIVVEVIGLMVLLILTIIIFKRCPEVLYSEKGTHISSLFIFQFCKDYDKRLKKLEEIDSLPGNKYIISNSPRYK